MKSFFMKSYLWKVIYEKLVHKINIYLYFKYCIIDKIIRKYEVNKKFIEEFIITMNLIWTMKLLEIIQKFVLQKIVLQKFY